MIQVIQAGQAGKTKYLIDMYRLRARIFKERLGWDVDVDQDGLETDNFDHFNTVYLLSCDAQDKVVGQWRILPTSGANMIEEVWPEFLKEINFSKSDRCWEVSRFGVLVDQATSMKESISAVNRHTAEMFCALTELCIHCDVKEIYTLYDQRIKKILRRINCEPIQETSPIQIDGRDTYVGRFIPDQQMLRTIKSATNITDSFIFTTDLPPIIKDYLEPVSRCHVGGIDVKASEKYYSA